MNDLEIIERLDEIKRELFGIKDELKLLIPPVHIAFFVVGCGILFLIKELLDCVGGVVLTKENEPLSKQSPIPAI